MLEIYILYMYDVGNSDCLVNMKKKKEQHCPHVGHNQIGQQ